MPNEIYHRSDWGESKAEGFGDVYYDHAATNKLYNHSDYYENSDGTDATLKDLNNKASIVLTPTAYSDGSLNTVIPPYQVLPTELVTNGNFDDGLNNWTDVSNWWSVVNGEAYHPASTSMKQLYQDVATEVNKKYKISVNVNIISGTPQVFWDKVSGQEGQNLTQGLNEIVVTTFKTNSRIYFGRVSPTNAEFYIDNVSVKEIQEADFDFSRGSSATRVNEQGLVEDVQILSGELVQNGNFEQIGAEEVTNGNFETDSDWTKGSGWSISDGKAIALNTLNRISQSFSTTTGSVYKVTFTVLDYVSGDVKVQFTGGTIVNSDWYNDNGTFIVYLTAESGNNSLDFKGRNGAEFTGSIDNVSVKEVGQNWSGINGATLSFDSNRAVVTIAAQSGSGLASDSTVPVQSGKKYKLEADVEIGTYTGTSVILNLLGTSSSAITIASSGVTRVSHIFDASLTTNTSARVLRGSADTGTLFIDNVSVIEITDDTDLPRIDFTDGTGSLLLEPQRTNLVTYSEDFSQWATAGTITVESGYLAPDGSTNAYKITDGAPSNNATALFLVGVAAADNARTIWAKTVSGTGTANLCSHNSNTNNLFTITNEWQRFEVNSATATGVTNFYGVDFRNSGTLTEILIWGAQTEVGDYATSYIPTSGSTVTRSADVANNSGNADLFNDSEGVLYADFYAEANNTEKWITLSDGTSTNRVIVYIPAANTLRIYVQNSSGAQADFASSITLSQYNKVAFSYKENDFKLFLNGTKVGSDTSGGVPSGLDRLNLADRNGTTNPFIGNVKCVAVFKEALSNDLLERLTGEGYESFRLLAEANNYTII